MASSTYTRLVRTRFRWRPLLLLAAVSLLAIPVSAAAQSARDRDLRAFQDSLAAASGNEALRALEQPLIAMARRNRSNPAVHVRLGMIALRLGETSGAVSEFKWASQLAPQWGVTWFGLAQAELALGEGADTTRVGRRAFLSRDAWDRAIVAFGRALLADTGVAGSMEAIARDRLQRDQRPSALVVRDGFRRAVQQRNRNAESVLGLGRVEALLGDTAAALTAFAAAAEVAGGKNRGLLEGARLRLTRAEPEALRTYYEVAAVNDTAVVAQLREDLAWIATADELALFDAASGAERASFLERFWTHRDREDLRTTGQRLPEHYRRLAVAQREYRNPFDQRVAVFVRHGAPDSRATLRVPGVTPNESWRYRRPEGDLFVHFAAGADTTNYRIVESVFDVAGGLPAGAPAGDEVGDSDSALADQLLRSRAQLAPFYQAAVAGRRDQLEAFKRQERDLGTAGRNLALTTDRYPLRFDGDLPARVQISALTGRADGGEVDALFVVPAFVFDSVADPAAPEPVRVRMVAWDSRNLAVRALDSTLSLVRETVADGQVLRGNVGLSLPAGLFNARIAIESGNRGVIVSREGLSIGSPDGGATLSELALGTVGSGLTWSLAGAAAPVAAEPVPVFDRRAALDLSADLIGFASAPGTRARAMVRSIRQDGKEERWRNWPHAGDWHPIGARDSVVSRVRMALPLRGLKAGRYEVELLVEQGETAVRRRGGFAVVEAER
ncbi:MAG: GWxTD domain-containing protein [Gemmatimonadales bacterium]